MNFAEIKNQAELAQAFETAKKSATEWKELAKEVLGINATSGKAARIALHQHYSDNLLLEARIAQVKKSFS